jgi:hypothetical protein
MGYLDVIGGLNVELGKLDDLLLERKDAGEALVGEIELVATLKQHKLIQL